MTFSVTETVLHLSLTLPLTHQKCLISGIFCLHYMAKRLLPWLQKLILLLGLVLINYHAQLFIQFSVNNHLRKAGRHAWYRNSKISKKRSLLLRISQSGRGDKQ